ncbi:MBL fold metallo-hydrolase [Bacillus massiliigorillae]|uniref:MBL fold metallo-hydrolase n=1 Tax=Bacillus massiliigorillae TaxID=1243664 RepID=UPI00039C67D8|nr:MBL fold metallo-hydrolase [Bacillus massiliigorillae]
MKYYQLPLGALGTNCYILEDGMGECVIFDPGGEGAKLIQFVKNKSLKPLAVLLTHAHFDHIGAVDDVREAFNIPVYLHKKEEKWLESPALNGSSSFMMGSITQKPADVLITKEEELSIGKFTFEMFETPGHSPGSVSYYVRDEGYLFSGDVLFQGSIGRTDLAGGSMEVLMQSIHQKLLPLADDTIVFPGHGGLTTIQDEKDYNPFLNGF